MKFLAALAALVASAQAGVIGLAGIPQLAGHVVPGPRIVGAVAQGPNVIPSRAHLPAAYSIEEAPIVNTRVEPVEQWALSVNW